MLTSRGSRSRRARRASRESLLMRCLGSAGVELETSATVPPTATATGLSVRASPRRPSTSADLYLDVWDATGRHLASTISVTYNPYPDNPVSYTHLTLPTILRVEIY